MDKIFIVGTGQQSNVVHYNIFCQQKKYNS